MNKVVSARLDMALRVRSFFRAVQVEDPGERAAIANFERLVDEVEARGTRQDKAHIAGLRSTKDRERLRREIQNKLLRYLVAVANSAAGETPDLQHEFRLPGLKVPETTFLMATRRMLDKALEHRQWLEAAGLSHRLLDDLGRAVARLEAAVEAGMAGHQTQVGATGGLRHGSSEILRQVKVLDGLVHYRFGDDVYLMAGWRNCRLITVPVRSRTGRAAENGRLAENGRPGENGRPAEHGGPAGNQAGAAARIEPLHPAFFTVDRLVRPFRKLNRSIGSVTAPREPAAWRRSASRPAAKASAPRSARTESPPSAIFSAYAE